jgi:hypothetical protein
VNSAIKNTVSGAMIGLLVLITSLPSAASDRYAILIGVSEYTELDPRFNLIGPRNDVLLMYQLLQQQNFSEDNVYLLTENHPKAIAPTRSNIFNQLEILLERASRDDFVYLHFSGHGSQQPAANAGDEIDGLDETFLPADTKNWNNAIRSIENAITDDDISNWLDKFRAKGIFVWLVFDSCHSGTMTRSQWQPRKIPSASLGVPSSRSNQLDNGAPVKNNSQQGDAGYVAFFAAQTTEETPEMDLPRRSDTPKRYGLFTFHLIQSLSRSPGATYRQVAEQILQNYGAQLWYGSRPMFTGSGLDAPVFGTESSGVRTEQWLINRSESGFEIPAGSLVGLGEQSLLAILKTPTDPLEKALGFAIATNIDPLTSRITMTEHLYQGKTYPVLTRVPALAHARLIESKVDMSLSISQLENPQAPSTKQVDAIIQQLRNEGLSPVHMDWQAAKDAADIRLFATPDEIVLLTDGEPLPCKEPVCDRSYIRIPLGEPQQTATLLANSLRTIAKAQNLMRLGTQLGSDALDMTLNVKRFDSGKLEDFDGSQIPTLYSGDQITLTIANFLEQPLDVTVLFIGSDYGVSVAFPRKGQFNRFMEEEEKIIKLGTINTDTTGTERIIVIATQASRTAATSNFAFLSQKGLSKARSNFRPIDALLFEAGFGNEKQPRGEMPIQESIKYQADIKTISWVTQKKKLD